MDITTEAGALFDNHTRLKNKALLLDITIVNPCAGSNLGNAARHVGKHLADVVERKKNKYRGSFPATYSLLPLAMSTCGEVGSDVHALIKELAIRRVQHRSKTHSNESQHLAEGRSWGLGRSGIGNGNGGGGERRSAGRERGRERGRGERGRGRGWRPVDEHRVRTGTGTGTEGRTVEEMGAGTRIIGTGTRIGLGRAEERRKSARNRKTVVDAMRETRETWMERGKNVENKGLVQ